MVDLPISIHALLAESDAPWLARLASRPNFYPRSPCGERLSVVFLLLAVGVFLSTLSLRRATPVRDIIQWEGIFLSTLSLRRATISTVPLLLLTRFLSTLSLRRATGGGVLFGTPGHISIHALLAESDKLNKLAGLKLVISIHALLAESDCSGSQQPGGTTNFYPRSPCGERHLQPGCCAFIHSFLSTLSLRRATAFDVLAISALLISIHALLAESDYLSSDFWRG